MRRALGCLAAVGVLAAGCAGDSSTASRDSQTALTPPTTTTTPPAAPPACAPAEDAAFKAMMADGGFASLRPTRPTAGVMPAGSFMQEIQRRRLVVGVDQNTLQFGYRDPFSRSLQGLDIELLREVARALWPDATNIDDHIAFKALTTAQRISSVKDASVDIVASLVTVNCPRTREVAFSSVYYVANQRFLVRRDAGIASAADLAGKRVCATLGSTSIDTLQQKLPDAVAVGVAARTDCLVALQQGKVDAITADDTILVSFQKQDPKTRILADDLSDEPYAIAMNQAHPEFVRFVNGVLEQMRADGRLASLYDRFVRTPDFTPPAPPEPRYVD